MRTQNNMPMDMNMEMAESETITKPIDCRLMKDLYDQMIEIIIIYLYCS